MNTESSPDRREGVLDGVLQQLGQDDGQGRGDVGGHLAHVAGHLDPDAVPRHHRVLGHPHQRPHDLVEGDLVAGLARQDLVDERDRPDPTLGLAQRFLALAGLEASGLEPEQRRDRLQVVLHPVVHLADGRVLRQQQAVEAAEVGDVAQQHHGAGHGVLLEQRRALHRGR